MTSDRRRVKSKSRDRRIALLIIFPIVVLLLSLMLYEIPHVLVVPTQNNIALQNFSICASQCTYPSPYITGIILINSSSPLVFLLLSVNGVNASSLHFNNDFSHYAYLYKGTFSNPIPIAGHTYYVRFVAIFQDSSIASSAMEVLAN